MTTAMRYGSGNSGGSGKKGMGMSVLWENTDTSSSYGANTIDIDLSNYDGVYVIFCSSTTSDAIVAQGFAFMSKSTIIRYPSYSGSTMRFYGRTVTVSTTGISISAGSYRQQGSSSETTANDRIIPVRIYGVKLR